MDGVLVDVKSSWTFVHQKFNKDNEKNFRRYLNGEIEYSELLKLDINLWGKIHINTLRKTLEKAPLMK
jgi:hypothetical protein